MVSIADDGRNQPGGVRSMNVKKLMNFLIPDHREVIARVGCEITDEDLTEISEAVRDSERRFYGSLIYFVHIGTHRFAIERQDGKIYAEVRKNPGNGWLLATFAVICFSAGPALIIRSDDFGQTLFGFAGIMMPVGFLMMVNLLSAAYFRLCIHKVKSLLAGYRITSD